MLLIDDLLTAPVRSLFWVFQQIHHAAQEEISSQKENITLQLSELYMMLETGRITEAEFNQREEELLDLLEGNENEEEIPD